MQKVASVLCPQSPQNKKLTILTKRGDFLKTYKGSQVRKEFLTLFYLKNKTGSARLGMTIPKTTGTSVVRNKFKRWLREEFRKRQISLPLDFHFLVKSKSKTKEDYKAIKPGVFKKEINDALNEVIKKH